MNNNTFFHYFNQIVTFLMIVLTYTIPVWILWWWIACYKFGLPYLNVFETAGLVSLCKILFKSDLTIKYQYLTSLPQEENKEINKEA